MLGDVVDLRAPRTLARCRLPVGLAMVSLLGLVLLAGNHEAFDLKVYAGAVRSWVGGQPLYDYVLPGTTYGFTYPPFAALAMLPIAVLPFRLAIAVNVVADAAIITATTWWLAAQVAPRWGLATGWATACAVPVVCLLEPVRDTVGYGQVNLALVALIVLDVEALRRGSRWAGVGTGLAAAVKLTPAVFIVMLLARRPRAALQAAGCAALATTAAFVVAPGTSRAYWTGALLDTSRVGRSDVPANQALSGFLTRLTDATTTPRLLWLAAVLLVGAMGLTRAVRAGRAGDDLAALALTGLTGSLVSPITWTHHLWWVVPAIAVLLRAGLDRRRWLVAAGAVTVLFVSSLPDHVATPIGQHTAHGPLVLIAESSYALACLLLVLFLPARAASEPLSGQLRPRTGAVRST